MHQLQKVSFIYYFSFLFSLQKNLNIQAFLCISCIKLLLYISYINFPLSIVLFYQTKSQYLFHLKMGIIKQINIKNRTYYIFNDMINIKGFDSSLLKKTKSHSKTLVFITVNISQEKMNIRLIV